MFVPLGMAFVMALGAQSASPDRARADQLVRSGRTAEAIAVLEQIVAANPDDVDVRLRIARLELRRGRTDRAEAGFRAVVRDHPADVDARVGLGAALTRKGAWRDALAILIETEPDAGENADLFAALARAYRRAGDDRRALEYFSRAKALAPADPDNVAGFEAVLQAYGHSIALEGFGEHLSTGTNTGSGTITLRLRARARLHLLADARAQHRSGSADGTIGGGVFWRAGRATTVAGRVAGGAGNTVLPDGDVSADVVHYAGIFEVGGGFRGLSFAAADVVAISPVMAWDPGGRWRLDGRYTYSRTSFPASDDSSGDHSVLVRETWRGWRRAAITLAYAYGIESFEDLTADRLAALGATTVAAGVRITLPLVTQVTTMWEHQWRSNSTAIDRVTVSLVQSFP